MTWKDKLEIGLKDDAPFRRDNLPDDQKSPGVPDVQPGDPSRSPEDQAAREEARRAAAEHSPLRTRAGARRRTAIPRPRTR